MLRETRDTQAGNLTPDPCEGLDVLVPLDGSDTSMKALEYARLFPLRSISLLHVIPDALRIQPPLKESEMDRWAEVAMPDLETLRSALDGVGIQSRIELRSGDVANEIVAAAENCDLIVMTTSGRGAAGRFVFGSVADRVSRSSKTPTLMIRGSLLSNEIKLPNRVLVPLDGSKRSEVAVAVAIDLARRSRLPIKLVRAVDLEDVLSTLRQVRSKSGQSSMVAEDTYDAAWKVTVDKASEYLEKMAEPLLAASLVVSTELLHGSPVFMLLQEIEESDLVVMTSHGLSGYHRWMLGSVAEKLIREAKSPILLVPTRDEIPSTRNDLTGM